MGPYCNYCGTRCFIHFPKGTPEHILKAYGSSTIIATCHGGQALERQRTGYSWDSIKDAIRRARSEA